MTTTIPQAQRRKEQKRRKRGLLIWGSVAAIGALITSAAFMDSEWAHIDPMGGARTGDHNLQSSKYSPDSNEFDKWWDYTEAAPLSGLADTKEALLPGDVVTSTYYVRNASDAYDSNAYVRLKTSPSDAYFDEEGDPGEAESNGALLNALQFTVTVGGVPVWDAGSGWNAVQERSLPLRTFNQEEYREVVVKVKVPEIDGLENLHAHLMVEIHGDAVRADTVTTDLPKV